MFLININEEGRHALTIDAVLSLYLIDTSEQVVVNFYKLVCCIIQFRLGPCDNFNVYRQYTSADESVNVAMFTRFNLFSIADGP